MLACTALVGCSDDAIENIAQENNELKSDAKGYLTVSFSAGTNSSRGLYDNANGDIHKDSENNGHLNVGTADENQVNEILIVISSENAEYCKIYTSTDFEGSGQATADDGSTITKYNDSYTTSPFEVELGAYKTLVVINPNAGVKALANTALGTNNENGKVTTVGLYNNILNYQVNPASATSRAANWKAAIDLVTKGTEKNNNFMMTNRLPVEIEVTAANNTKNNPAGKDTYVEVERVVSKITFRSHEDDTYGENVYKVPFHTYKIVSVVKGGYYNTDENKVTKVEGFVRYKNGEDIIWSKTTDETVKYYTLNVDDAGDNIFTELTLELTNVVEYPEQTTETEDRGWYIKLNKYALVNLSQDLYAVRHIGSPDYSANDYKIMGALNTSYPYLIDPVSNVKNNVIWTSEGNWPTSVTSDNWNSWFFNSWADVSKATATYDKENDYFIEFGNNQTTDKPQDVNTPHDPDDDSTTDNSISIIGKTLGYCFENAVKQFNTNGQDLQAIGLSTAIVFEANIMKAGTDGLENITETLYQYQGNVYSSIEDIVQLYGISGTTADWTEFFEKTTVDGVDTYTLKDENNLSDSLIESVGVKIYKGGKCYYYTSQIKHFDDGNNATNGVMEFAIMRNNIYSLAITGIQHIGDANLEGFKPGEPDESDKAYIQVNAKILPWIVRFTDVEF